MATSFATVYNYFLDKITDDMYMELTPQDTLKDLQRLLITSIPGFEFPRKDLYDYEIKVVRISETDVEVEDFIIGIFWDEMADPNDVINPGVAPDVLVDRSCFNIDLSPEEVNILALLMK